MLKVLLISLGIFLLLRPLVRYGLGYFVKRSLNDMSRQAGDPRSQQGPKKPEGTVTIEKANENRGSEFTDYEEVE